MARMRFTLTSPSLGGNNLIGIAHTCDGSDAPPLFEWSHAPAHTRSLVLVMEDLDQDELCHWLVWDIPPVLDTDQPMDVNQMGAVGTNDMHGLGYKGPCPPRKEGEHRYRIRMCALDIDTLGLESGARRTAVEQAIDGHILATAELIVRYARGPVVPAHESRLQY